MNGFCGIFGSNLDEINKDYFKKSINLASTLKVDFVEYHSFFATTSFLESSPLQGNRIYKNDNYIILFAGDLIEHKKLPWHLIELHFKESNFKWFSSLRGIFAFTFLNIKSQRITLISDHRTQLPIYYGVIKNNFIFSTHISTFTTLKSIPEFNIDWLYEFLYFNYPIDQTTFIKGVKRLRPVTRLIYSKSDGNISEKLYSDYLNSFEKKKNNKKIDLNECISIFKKIVPKYFDLNGNNIAAATAGFDSKALISLSPLKIDTYTYGIKGSADMIESQKFTKKYNYYHKRILFDKNFKKLLPDLIYDVVKLSGGQQSISRATLLYVYKSLAKLEKPHHTVISGISGGSIFRGGGNIPSVISKELGVYFSTGKIQIDDLLSSAFIDKEVSFKKHIENCIKKINTFYGKYNDPETYLLFQCYEVAPKYFGGELAIANNFVSLRVPFWDHELIKLSFSTNYSTLKFSKFREKNKFSFSKNILLSKIISGNPKLKFSFIQGMPVILYATKSIFLFKLSKLFIRGYAYLTGYRPSKTPLEDWNKWFDKNLKNEFEEILPKDNYLKNYLTDEYINNVMKSNNIHLISKIITSEIILKLINNKWNIE